MYRVQNKLHLVPVVSHTIPLYTFPHRLQYYTLIDSQVSEVVSFLLVFLPKLYALLSHATYTPPINVSIPITSGEQYRLKVPQYVISSSVLLLER